MASDRFNEMGLLIKVISHEMGNALNVMNGALTTKEQMGEEFYSDKELIDLVFEGVVHAQTEYKLIKDFIDLVSKGHDLDRAELKIEDVIGFLRVSGIDMKAFEITGDVKLSVSSNRYGLCLVVLNLLRNAVEAAKSDVQLSIHEEADCARLEIKDDGPGMSKEQLDKLWDDESTKTDETRVRGLGTQIVAFLCEQLSIAISVESEIGAGTRFSLGVPK